MQATGAVATSIVDGLKSQPAMLVIVVLNAIIFLMLGYLAYQNAERRAKRELLILEHCLPKHSGGGEVTTGGTDAVRP